MALFRVSNNRAQFDAAGNDASDQYGAGIRFTQGGNARVTTATPTNYNQGIPMSATGQVAIVDATAGLPAGTIFHNGLPISADKVCVSRNATAVVSNGLPYDAAGAVAGDINLDLNFIGTDTLNSSITFTRASTGTFFNSAGVLTSAAINAPRFDYDPVTLAARGLLIEEQRTNLFQRSEEFNDAYWTPLGSTVTANSTIAPTNTNVADTLTEDTSTGEHRIGSSTIAWIGNTQYTATFFAKANGRTRFDILLGTLGNWVNGERVAQFDISNGTVSAPPGTPAVASIQSIGNGWYRCRITATTTAAPTASGVFIRLCDATGSASYTGNGTSGIFLFGAQVEAGAFPTSYIPTTTTALTRPADVASVNTLSPWYNATAGTLYAEYIAANSAQNNVATSLSDGTNDNRMIIRATNSSAQTVFIGVASTVTQWNDVILTALLNTTTKSAFAYATNDIAWVRNGGTVGTDTTATIPTVNRLQLGLDGAGTFPLNGYLRRITYYPRKLSSAELQAITA